MKKNVLFIVSALACGLMLAGCGGTGSGSGGSKLKKNDYLGSLPALYESYNADLAALEAKVEEEGTKLFAGGEKNAGKIQKLFDDQKAREKAMKEKFEADVKAETAKLAGKDVPVSYSEQLKNSGKLYYTVTQAKIVEEKGEPKLAVTIAAKDDFTIPSMKAYDYTIYYRLAGAEGASLQRSASVIIPVALAREAKEFRKGDELNKTVIGFNLSNYPADRAAFSGIEFITKEEYDSK